MSETTETVQAAPAKRRRRRRGWQRGSIYQRGSGWTIAYRTKDGKQIWQSGFKSKADAKSRLDEATGQIQQGTFTQPELKLFKDFCEEWLEYKKHARRGKKQQRIKPSTLTDYESKIRKWFIPEFGEFCVSEITKQQVIGFFDKLPKHKHHGAYLSLKFIKNAHTLLRLMFDDAEYRDLAAHNPARGVKIETGRQSQERIVPSKEDVTKTFVHLPSLTYQAMFWTATMAGLRKGEFLGLRWQDVDIECGVLRVRRELQRVKKSLLDTNAFEDIERIGNSCLALLSPKSATSIRDLEIPSGLRTLLAELRRTQHGEPRFVFQDELGLPLDPDGIDEPLYAAQDSANVRRFGWHGLRHLHCSMLQDSGANAKQAQERMGHASADITNKVYTHKIEPHGHEFADRVEAAFPIVSHLLQKKEKTGAASTANSGLIN